MDSVFVGRDGRLRVVLRIALFVLALALAVAPLLLVQNSLLQFLFANVILVAMLVVWARYVDRRPFADYGLVPTARLLFGIAVGLVIGTVSVAIIFGASVALGAAEVSSLTTAILDSAFLMFFIKMLLVAVWEETFFRGFLFTNIDGSLAKKTSARTAAIGALLLSSLIFAAAHSGTDHMSVASFAILTLNGVILCIPFLLTGSLGLSIGFHAAWNFAQSKLFGFAMSGNAADGSLITIEPQGPVFWTGGAYGPEAGLSGVTGFFAALALFLLVIRLFPLRVSGLGSGD
ncbi:CPBP family intramembrane glutamic endopeptidase [Parasphingopyxis marina]|uniref:CPBP family intramembrane metalloprotease n=1 Tax=Parasphingopyxis marina TaxID=2761622 RepID=A0A842I1B5_9SPHN|nr:CPBP family intramembrane glutamic endopeptidase [Parasphingopyxis marina]MBC2778459.1 CPBP family intramembrane metalloprotease [Parasphingopyxis marina]